MPLPHLFFLFLFFLTTTISLLPSSSSSSSSTPSAAPESSPSPYYYSYSSPPSQNDLAPESSPSSEELSDNSSPSPSPEEEYEDDNEDEPHEEVDSGSTVRWCAIRDEFSDCEYYISLLETGTYRWSCVRKESAMECLEAVSAKEADIVTLDAGLAYIALMNYSIKAIMAEEYCYHKKSYDAVAVVSKEVCERNPRLNLEDFRGKRSCHPGYRTGAGWNYPIQFIVENGLQIPEPVPMSDDNMHGDESIVSSFFSETCAPSEFDGTGLCTSCGNNGSCDNSLSSIYRGYSGAYRCLMEEIGDIAFLRSDTALRLSNDGMNARNWSTKSVADFMYLCPNGGCKPINDNIDSCSFGSVPSNVIMTFNSQTNKKRSAIVKTLLNATWVDAVYSGNNSEDHVFSASTQNLVEIKELTRSYLGASATIAQTVSSVHYDNSSSFLSNGNHRFGGFSCIVCFVMTVVLGSIHSPVL